MPMTVKSMTLAGNVVRLEPLGKKHISDLYLASQDQDIWTYMPVNPSRSPEVLTAWVEAALAAQAEGSQLPFAIIDAGAGRAIGSTRYLNISGKDYGLEIGWTWLAPEARRTAVNTECKYLLLRHAFESLGAIRVQFKTDSRNERSRRAILRLGAVQEGVLRKHMVLESGYQRDSVVFSIISAEWPVVKTSLETKLGTAPSA
jgi:RimJ/RimL family protein N-acetyltransferase